MQRLAGLLYQSGYLTRRPADPDASETSAEALDFPNREVKEAFTDSLHQWYQEHVAAWLQAEAAGPTGYLAQLRRSLREGDAVAVQGTLSSCPGILPYVLRNLPPTVRRVADYEVFCQSLNIPALAEAATPAGRLDSVVELDGRIPVLELKVAASPEAALKQAFLRDYTGLFRTRSHPVTVYGLQFDVPAHTILACRAWDLGRYNAWGQQWEREPFPVSLAELGQWPLADRKAYIAATVLPEPIRSEALPASPRIIHSFGPTRMPRLLHIQMTASQRQTLQRYRRDPNLSPRERDRVEMYLLSAQGWTVPRLAVHLDVCEATVRRWIHLWEAQGLQSLRHQKIGRPPDTAQRKIVFRALTRLLSQDQVWSARTLAAALAREGLDLQPRTVHKYLHLMGARYQRLPKSPRSFTWIHPDSPPSAAGD